MAQISSSTGLISGINYGDIINQLMSLEQRPVNTLQTRIDAVNQQKLAFTDLTTRLTSLKLNGTTLKKTSAFQNATTTSSDENVLTATATTGAAVGSYQFQVARLVTTQQSVTRGFADFASARSARAPSASKWAEENSRRKIHWRTCAAERGSLAGSSRSPIVPETPPSSTPRPPSISMMSSRRSTRAWTSRSKPRSMATRSSSRT
jgi:flagellar capping protein FliD